ncbi:MAG: hypothetical protein A3H96_12865 [Acidobacteria bacterium RIFCSPLOWO2_02_FULL_67_36]|nr:MAG: hypothetical protein A3H96_12865 [Acidobacteria bacterium RIFCSPLOWO2_02_FULL_67_36]OFW23514.1 MAG: hypothetical protein A3G21_06175 [Acidobacteria bacterium RIFCSPLOWO2_12_FULL_66_21]
MAYEDDFRRVLETHGRSLARLAACYARDRADGDDRFQEIAIAIWRAMPSFRRECSERTFPFRIAHNRGLSHLARHRLATSDVEEESNLPDAKPDPEQALSNEQQGQRLESAVQRLPVGRRQVVTLALEGMSYAKIAEVIVWAVTAVLAVVAVWRRRTLARELHNLVRLRDHPADAEPR